MVSPTYNESKILAKISYKPPQAANADKQTAYVSCDHAPLAEHFIHLEFCTSHNQTFQAQGSFKINSLQNSLYYICQTLQTCRRHVVTIYFTDYNRARYICTGKQSIQASIPYQRYKEQPGFWLSAQANTTFEELC